MNWTSVKEQAPPTDRPILVSARVECLNLDFVTGVKLEAWQRGIYVEVIGARPDDNGEASLAEFDYEHITHWSELPTPPNA